jgi:hypothetical protein
VAGLFVFGEWRGPGARLPLHLACRGYAVANLPGLGCGQAQPRHWHSPAQHMDTPQAQPSTCPAQPSTQVLC